MITSSMPSLIRMPQDPINFKGTSSMQRSQRALLKRILASCAFSRTLNLGRILSYVCEQTANSERSLKEYEIATEVLRRPKSFDPRVDPVVRVSMMGVRERLRAYFAGEGKQETLQLAIPKGQYRAKFFDVPLILPPTGEADTDVRRWFWKPYLRSGLSNLIVSTEPLFFRAGSETYVRDADINDPVRGPQQIKERLPELGAKPVCPSYHYLDAGEVHSILLLMHFFHDMGVGAEMRNARTVTWNEIGHSNLILIGCSRTNPFVDRLQEQTGFVIMEGEIRNLSPREGELHSYTGGRYQDSKLLRYREYVLVDRKSGVSHFSTVTTIASNHGRAIEGATNQLVIASELTKILSRMSLDKEANLPSRFQILLRVEMLDLDDEIVDVEYVSHRVSAE